MVPGKWHSINKFLNRYSLVAQESSNEDETAATLDIDVGSYASSLKSQAADINSGKELYVQLGSEYRTGLVFKWLKVF